MFPLAVLYRIGYVVHHKLCLAPGRPTEHAQVLIVGSYRIGGAGKTPFCAWLIEAIRQLRWELGRRCICVHLTYVPYISAAKELKTKPTQHSVKLLQQEGIQPDVLVLRTEHQLPPAMLKKVAQFCNVSADAVTQSLDVPTIYEVPLKMHEQRLDNIILEKTGLKSEGEPDLTKWNDFLAKLKGATKDMNFLNIEWSDAVSFPQPEPLYNAPLESYLK